MAFDQFEVTGCAKILEPFVPDDDLFWWESGLEKPFDDGFDERLLPHVYYTLAGAASVIFAIAPECERLTGMDPKTDEAIERHAEFVARLLVP